MPASSASSSTPRIHRAVGRESGAHPAGRALSISNLENRNLYKSMTSHADHTVWHDVYHADTQRGVVYLKLTIVENLLIISFKEQDE